MKSVVGAVLAVFLVATTGSAQGVIAGGPHDFSNGSALRNSDAAIGGQTCIFCHTPHGSALLTLPLWNRSTPAGPYTVYSSTTTDSTTTSASIIASSSGGCLSCHDGSIAIDVLTNLNGLPKSANTAFTTQAGAKATFGNSGTGTNNIMTGGLPFLSTDLRNDHPINIIYETARAATPSQFVTQVLNGVKVQVGAVNPLPLFGASTAVATVECASCHNAHDNTNTLFLRKSNSGSAICLSCHIK